MEFSLVADAIAVSYWSPPSSPVSEEPIAVPFAQVSTYGAARFEWEISTSLAWLISARSKEIASCWCWKPFCVVRFFVHNLSFLLKSDALETASFRFYAANCLLRSLLCIDGGVGFRADRIPLLMDALAPVIGSHVPR